MYVGDEIIRGSISSSLYRPTNSVTAEDEEACCVLNGTVCTPTQILNRHCYDTTRKGKSFKWPLSCAAQEFAFPFYTFRRTQRAIFVPAPWYWFPGPYPFSFSKACKWMTAAHNAGIQIHFMMTGSLGPLFLHSFVCQRDYCNISGLQYPHLSLWAVSQPKFDRWVSSSLSHDMHTLAGITSAGQIGKRWVRACTQKKLFM